MLGYMRSRGVVFVFLILPGISNGADLMQIYELALKNDPVLSSAFHENQAVQERLEQGKALFRPSVSLTGTTNRSETNIEYVGAGNVYRNNGHESFDSYGYSVNINQPVFRKQISAQYEQAKSQVRQADAQLVVARQDLIVRTSQAYFDVLFAQDTIDLIQAQKSAITQQLDFAKANFDAGVATVTDVYEAQAKYDLVKAQEISANNQLQVKQRALQSIIKQAPPRLNVVASMDAVPMPVAGNLDEWLAITEQSNLNLIVKQRSLDIAAQEVQKQRAAHLPTLDAVASYSDNRANGGVNGFGNNLQNATVGFQLQLPIYQGGSVNSRVREAVANKMKSEDDLEETRRKAMLDTSQSYLDLVSSLSQIAAYEKALASGQSQVEATTKGYQVGLRTTVDILNAQQQLFSAKRDLLQAKYAYLLNTLKLKFAAGLLTEQDLQALNKAVQP